MLVRFPIVLDIDTSDPASITRNMDMMRADLIAGVTYITAESLAHLNGLDGYPAMITLAFSYLGPAYLADMMPEFRDVNVSENRIGAILEGGK